MKLKFEWDEDENSRNIRKHGLDFYDAQDLFSGIDPYFVILRQAKILWKTDGKVSVF